MPAKYRQHRDPNRTDPGLRNNMTLMRTCHAGRILLHSTAAGAPAAATPYLHMSTKAATELQYFAAYRVGLK